MDEEIIVVDCFRIQWILSAVINIFVIRYIFFFCFVVTFTFEELINSEIAIDFIIKNGIQKLKIQFILFKNKIQSFDVIFIISHFPNSLKHDK